MLVCGLIPRLSENEASYTIVQSGQVVTVLSRFIAELHVIGGGGGGIKCMYSLIPRLS